MTTQILVERLAQLGNLSSLNPVDLSELENYLASMEKRLAGSKIFHEFADGDLYKDWSLEVQEKYWIDVIKRNEAFFVASTTKHVSGEPRQLARIFSFTSALNGDEPVFTHVLIWEDGTRETCQLAKREIAFKGSLEYECFMNERNGREWKEPKEKDLVPVQVLKRIQLKVGDEILGRFLGRSKWYKGKISAINPNGTFHIQYDDGEREEYVARDNIQLQRATGTNNNAKMTLREAKRLLKLSNLNDIFQATNSLMGHSVKEVTRHQFNRVFRKWIRDSNRKIFIIDQRKIELLVDTLWNGLIYKYGSNNRLPFQKLMICVSVLFSGTHGDYLSFYYRLFKLNQNHQLLTRHSVMTILECTFTLSELFGTEFPVSTEVLAEVTFDTSFPGRRSIDCTEILSLLKNQ